MNKKNMQQMKMRRAAIVAAVMMAASMNAQVNDSLSTDTTLWYNQTQQLGEVVVKSQLPKTRVKGDAMRTVVVGSILEKAGTVTDLLSRIPQLSAKKDGGGVEVFGRGAAEVYINGRRVQDLKELDRLRSEQILHVDVVQNPGARYAASTKAVVRIQLKRAQGEGWSFTESADAQYRYSWSATNNLDVNYRTGGLDVTGSFWAGTYGNRSLQENGMNYYVGPDHYSGYSKQDHSMRWKGFSPQLQLNYQIDDNHSLGAYYKFDRNPSHHASGWLNTDNYENGQYIERSENYITNTSSFTKHILNGYYNGKVGKLQIDFNVDALFDKTADPNTSDETVTRLENVVNPKQFRHVENDNEARNRFWATKLILSYPLWNGNLSGGGEYSYNNRRDTYTNAASDGDGATVVLPVVATDNTIKETVASAFVEYGRQFGKVFTQVGLRYEHLGNDYYNFGEREDEVCRTYGDWFPTAMISVPIGRVQTALSYRKDIERPAYSNLTSSTICINRYSYQSGNPYLVPTYTHSLVLNLAYQWANLTVNYQRVKNSLSMRTDPMPGSNNPLISLIHPFNSDEDFDRLTINPSLRPTIGCWHPTWSAGVQLQNYKTLCAEGTMKTLDKPYWQFVWHNDLELPHAWRLTAHSQLTTKGDVNNYRITRTLFHFWAGVQHDLSLRQLGMMTLDLRFYDPFQTAHPEGIIYSIRELTTRNPARRTFSLTATWKFNEAPSKYRGSGAGQSQKSRM